jgi:hypothetical protein
MTVRSLSLPACLLASLTAVNLLAAQIPGGFSIAGDANITQSTIEWANVNIPFTALQAIIGGDSIGWFSNLDGVTIGIDDLNRSTGPVASDFGPDAFIIFNFDADLGMATLGIDSSVDGIPASECSASFPAMGQTCAPALPVTLSGSPFSLVKNPGSAGAPPIRTTVACALGCTTSDDGAEAGNFSAAFDEPFQTVVSDFPASGSITDTFAATITAATKAEPDGRYMLGSGLGLILLSLGSRRLLGKRQAKRTNADSVRPREAMVRSPMPR